MKSDFAPFIKNCLQESAKIKIKTAKKLSQEINQAAKMTIEAYRKGNKILLCGNGGSAADCQHLAAELVGRFKKERKPLPAIALTTNTSVLTALANDYGYDLAFVRQIEALGKQGDILYCLSTSGNSLNIIKAADFARRKKIFSIGLLGSDGGKLKSIVNLPIVIPENSTDRIQEIHITIGHIICGLIEKELFK
jgi:D-sedoheptulose 7-phosphate isomerase